MNKLTVERNKDGDFTVVVPRHYAENILNTFGADHTAQVNYLINVISGGIYEILFQEFFDGKGED